MFIICGPDRLYFVCETERMLVVIAVLSDMDQAKQHQLLREFLTDAGLQQHFDVLVNELKVHSTAQLKYVHKEDLVGVGISKSDAQRLLKQCQKARHGALSKFKKVKPLIQCMYCEDFGNTTIRSNKV